MLCLSVFLCLPGAASAKRLFVLDDATGAITEYDTEDFSVKQTIQIPADLYSKTDGGASEGRLLISESGRVLFYRDDGRGDGVRVRKLWFWDGKEHRAEAVSSGRSCKKLDAARGKEVMEQCSEEYFSDTFMDAEEAAFYWEKETDTVLFILPEAAVPRAVKVESALYKLSFSSGKLSEEPVFKIPFRECECTTGACDETCPTALYDTPEGGVRDFMAVAHFVSGQLQSSIAGYTYLEKRDDRWAKTTGKKRFEKLFAEVVHDEGCCGWANESSDKLLLVDGKTGKTLYDEWDEFGNRNYDISFYVMDAEVSPDFKNIAFSIGADAYEGEGEIRLSADGKEDAAERERIMAALKGLPAVKVRPARAGGVTLSVKNAALVGWLDSRSLLILKDGSFGALDVSARKFTQWPIRAASTSQVYLR